ncbi:MAG: PspC domain-containing protein [Chloroflexota bacterium]|nr:PspC domain-containing protein [Chloroflexota bacterium]
MNRRLYRSRREEMISGVAGGVAEYLDLDPSIVRVVWAVLAIITGGVFFIVYVVMWIVVPQAPEGAEPPGAGGADSAGAAPSSGWVPPSGWAAQSARRAYRHSGGGSWVFGLILIGLGAYFLAREYLPDLDVDRLWPLGLVVLGLLFMLVAFRRRD